jgi:hypothetical protein
MMSQSNLSSFQYQDANDLTKVRKIKTKEEAFNVIDLYLSQQMPFEVFDALYGKSEMLKRKFSFLLAFHKFWFQSYIIFDSIDEIIDRFSDSGAIITLDNAYKYMGLEKGQHLPIDTFLEDTLEGKTISLPVTEKQVEIIKRAVPSIIHKQLKLNELMYLTLLPYSQLLAIIFDL